MFDGARLRKLLKILAIIGMAAVVLAVTSTITNLVLGAYEQATFKPYGERVSIDGGEVNVSVTGTGEQTVMLLSGYGTASPALDFTPLIKELKDEFTVVVIERFGYGYSDKGATERTVENISTELHDTLATLGVKGYYLLMVHSMAGIYSLDYVNRFPGEVSGTLESRGPLRRKPSGQGRQGPGPTRTFLQVNGLYDFTHGLKRCRLEDHRQRPKIC